MATLKKAKTTTVKKEETVKTPVIKVTPKVVAQAIKAEPVKKVAAAVKPAAAKVCEPVTPKTVATPECCCKKETVKPVEKKSEPASKEENLKKLSKTSLASKFVKETQGNWDHQAWIEFCAVVEESGYTPIDFDQVGLLLEAEKAAFFASLK